MIDPDNKILDKYISSMLTIINLLPEDQKLFIKENITFKGEPWPIGYKKVILESDMDWSQIRGEYAKVYGWTTIRDTSGKHKKRIVKEIEPVPEGWRIVGSKKDN